MIPELGTVSLALAMLTALVMAGFGLRKTVRPKSAALMRSLASAHLLALALTFAAVLIAFITTDLSVETVYKNSHDIKPLLYKITGVWGNHEGSILLWAMIGAAYIYGFTRFAGARMPARIFTTTCGVLGLLSAAITAYVLFLSSPLKRLDGPLPEQGRGLNPLLQDIGLAIHPPMLYLGFLGLIIPYALAVAYLVHSGKGKDFARQALPWTSVSFAFLSFGIILGSWWAYRELGWGGWWFWDPVENASLVPWFLAAALAHSLLALRTRSALMNWSMFLAICGFSASVLGAFLVRSGLLVSVHTFAADPKRGIAIFAYLAALLLGGFIVFALKAKQNTPPSPYDIISREGALLSHNLLGATAALTVIVGTLYPVIIQLLKLPLLSVGEPYFHASVVPLLVLATFAMAIGPQLPWRSAVVDKSKRKTFWTRRLFGLIAAIAVSIIAFLAFDISLMDAAALGGGAGIILSHLTQAKAARKSPSGKKLAPMIVAHIGVGLFAISGAASVIFAQSGDRAIGVGESKTIAGYEVTLEALDEGRGANYFSATGEVHLKKDGRAPIILYPEFRYYPVSDIPTSEADIKTTLIRDVYVTINAIDRQEDSVTRWAVRIQQRPMILWLWISVLITVFGIFWAALNQFKALPVIIPSLKSPDHAA